jgi:acyl-coenzyme A synthetase/AMP-(fatty) acid ligase
VTLDLAALAARHGEALAVRAGTQRWRFAELAERIRTRAARLSARGLGPGARVGLVCAQAPDTLVAVAALLARGCAVLPLGPGATAPERARLLAAFGAGWLVDGEELLHDAAAPAAPDAPGVALAMPSSGSTGAPKLVLRSPAQVLAAAEIFVRAAELGPGEGLLALVPLEHSYGLHHLAIGGLLAGAPLVFAGAAHPRAVSRACADAGVALLPAPPVFLDRLARHHGPRQAPLAGLRAAISVGSALGAEVHDAFGAAFGVPVWQSYGASEAGAMCLNRAGLREGRVLALGPPCPGVELSVCDDAGAPLPDGRVGELVARSAAVALGYAGPHDGASRLAEGRFFTGDLGERRDGVFWFRGRRKLLIAVSGRKVDPFEVEAVLCRHPDVAEAAVVAERAGSREIVKALVVARREVAAEALVVHCAAELAAYKVPRAIEFRASLPRSAAGKLVRERLAAEPG